MKRRQFLFYTAVAATGDLLAAPARALVIEAAPPAIDAAYALRCQVDPAHAGLIRETREMLAQNKEAVAALDALTKDLKKALTCPYCGCTLTLEATPAPVRAPF